MIKFKSKFKKHNKNNGIEIKNIQWEWIDNGTYVTCPVCEIHWTKLGNDLHWFNYCPNCSADMRGGIK